MVGKVEAPRVLVSGLSVELGKRIVLDDISFAADQGVLALVGPNGAGKTTLLRCLCGDLEPRTGIIQVGGSSASSALRRGVSYLPQSPQLHPRMTCAEFVSYCAWLRNLTARRARQETESALAAVGLLEQADSRVMTLSGGMRRRLAIAAALVGSPDVVLLDEPMAGLDPEQRFGVRRVIKELRGRALIVLATHVMQDVPELTDRIVMLDSGHICYDGDLDGFIGSRTERSAEALERAFVGHLSRRDPS